MNDNIYLHAINVTNNGIYIDTYDTYILLYKILKCHALLSSRLQKSISNDGFNGVDYISLCDYSKRDIFNGESGDFNAFSTYIRYSLSIMFPKDKFDVIEPTIIEAPTLRTAKDYVKMKKLGLLKGDHRYSDMPDEVQVRDKVSLDHMIGLTYPIHLVRHNGESYIKKIERIMCDLDTMNFALSENGYDVPIYDVDTLAKLDGSREVEYVLRHEKRNYR